MVFFPFGGLSGWATEENCGRGSRRALGVCASLLHVMNFRIVFMILKSASGLSEISGDSSLRRGDGPTGVEPPAVVDLGAAWTGTVCLGPLALVT